MGGVQTSLFHDKEENVAPAEEAVTVPEHKRKKKRTHDDWISSLPVEEIVHEEELW